MRPRPWSIRSTRSLIIASSPRSWLATRIVVRPRISSIRLRRRMRCPGSSPDSGSSRKSNPVGRIRAMASASRRRIPLDSESARPRVSKSSPARRQARSISASGPAAAAASASRLVACPSRREHRVFRQVADTVPAPVVRRAGAGHRGLAVNRRQHPQKRAEEGRLARAVGSHHREYLAGHDVEGESTQHRLPPAISDVAACEASVQPVRFRWSCPPHLIYFTL